MISQYSRPRDIDREFWEDYPKAVYWLNKNVDRRKEKDKIFDDSWDVLNFSRDYSFSAPVFYESPQTGNKWMLWVTTMRRNDGIHFYTRAVLYHMTAEYMTMMMPMVIQSTNKDDEVRYEMQGVNIYTAHLFQRMAQKDRLGVDMSDRYNVMRNFSEFVATGWSDTRPPRDGERHTQILFRTPGSWLRGHTVFIKEHHVTIYRTFYTDRSMSYAQLKDVRSFKKFADAKMNNKE